jgi:DNA-binding transcriptional LysR family regulator
VFQAIANEGSVTRAAQRLGRSQSSTSEALARLRESLNDPLFWRSGGKMIPSPRARQLEPVIQSILHNANRLITNPQIFDPKEASGEIRLCMTDYGSTLILPQLHDVSSK